MKTIKQIIIIIACILVPVIAIAASRTSVTSAQQEQAGFDLPKLVSVVSGLLTGIAVIVGTLISVFKSFRAWVVKKVRKALHIVDIEALVDETTKKQQKDLQEAADERRGQLKTIGEQYTKLGEEIKNLVEKVEKLNKCVEQSQVSDKAILREGITRIYYKYYRQKKIAANERENVSQLHAAYDSIKINGDHIRDSYVHDLYEEIKTWDIIYPDERAGDQNAR